MERTEMDTDHYLKQMKRAIVAFLLIGCFFLASGRRTAYAKESDTYNLLLIGSDRRDESWNGNSDVMILVTINNDTRKLILTSFMRDLYADIPGYGVHKLNYAYAVGGAETLMETIEDNYDLNIDNYASADFDSMAEIIDLAGGVDIDVSDEEAVVLNQYLDSVGESGEELPCGGSYHLDGAQAVAYMRIRYVGNSDYERTERQRRVLSEIFENAKSLSAAQISELAVQVFAMTDHDISAVDMLRLISSLSDLTSYELVENRVPYDGLYTSQDEMLVPDFDATIQKLHGILFE